VSTKAVAASCLAQIAKYYPTTFEEYSNKQGLISRKKRKIRKKEKQKKEKEKKERDTG
jgi:hypothetical protein